MALLSQKKTLALLRRFSIPVARSAVFGSLDSLESFASSVGYPVVLKIESEMVVHKSDAGGVIANIKGPQELRSAYDQIRQNISKNYPGLKDFRYLIQKQLKGKEVIIGMNRDPQFGPVIMAGLGGIFVEVLKDVSLRIAPVSRAEAKSMLAELKSYTILTGVRGDRPVDIDAIVDTINKLSRLSLESKDISEIDFNPVMVDEKGAYVVDARIITGDKD